MSSAHALGLIQVTPEPATIAEFNVAYDQSRLLNDTIITLRDLAAELAGDTGASGSCVRCSLHVSAGRGRVKEWIERYGVPPSQGRSIDWVEPPVSRDPQLRPARHREHSGLSCAVRRRQTPAD
jgi:hypothetical protein